MITKKLNATYYINKSVDRLRELKQEIATKEEELKKIVQEIKAFMEDEGADALMDPEGVRLIGILQQRGGIQRFDAAKFKEEKPEEFQKYVVETETYNVFLPK